MHVWRSSRECSLVTIVRTRALPSATVGKTTDVANTPSSNRRAASCCALRLVAGHDRSDRRLADARVEAQLLKRRLEELRVVPQPLDALGLVLEDVDRGNARGRDGRRLGRGEEQRPTALDEVSP